MKKQILILISLLFFGVFVFAQGITNKGAVIKVNSGTYVTVSNGGGYFNESDGSNHGQIDLDGTLQIEGNFENNAGNNVFINRDADGMVVFNGSGTQTITTNAFDMSNYVDFEGVTVNSGSTTELAAGSAATINAVFTVNGTFTSKTPLSDAASGSIITNSSIEGTGDVNLERYFKVGNRWMYISVPIANQTSTPLIDTPYPGYVNPNFYTLDETFAGDDPDDTNYSNWDDFSGMWVNVGTGVTLNEGTGYIWNAYNASDLNITFSSSAPSDIYTGDFDISVTYTDNDDGGTVGNGLYYDGWNLIGNPFPSAIDWTSLTRTTSMDNTVYYFDGVAGNYIYYDAGGGTIYQGDTQTLNTTGSSQYIPAYQAFIVHLSPSGVNDDNSITTETFTLANSARVHSNQVMYKNNEKEDYDFQYLKLRTEDGDFSDETIVRFIDGTHDEFNGKEDAFKMFSIVPNVPMLYSLTINSNEYPLAINSLPVEDIGTTIPLGFKTQNSGTFNIKVKEFNFDAGTDVKLIDTYENTETSLFDGTEYTFSSEAGEFRDRFYLFSVISSDVNNPEDNTMSFSSNVWSNRDNIYISIKSDKLIDANVKVYDVLGRTVVDQNVNGTYNIINIPWASGTYFVKLTGGNGISQTKKVFIKK